MNFWQPFLSLFRGRQTSGTQVTGPGGYSAPSAVPVTEETALQVTAVWACVRLLSQTIASLPLLVYRNTDSGREVVEDHWFAKLMARGPNQYQTRYEFWEHQVANLVLHGNFYNKVTRVGGIPRSILPMSPQQTETKLVSGSVAHLYTQDGNVTALSSASVWHVRMNGDLIVGKSPLHFGRNMLGVAQGAERIVSSMYQNGSKPSGVLSMDRLLTPEQRGQIRESFAGLTTGNDDRLLVLENGTKFEAISLSPQDIELLASRRYNVDDVARWFGVPSILINQNEGSTTLGSSTAEIIQTFYKLGLRPVLEAVECSIKSHLFTEADAAFDVEFDFEGLLRASQKERYEGYREGINSGVITPNEARAMEWLAPRDGGDRLFVQGAMIPMAMAGQQNQPPEGE